MSLVAGARRTRYATVRSASPRCQSKLQTTSRLHIIQAHEPTSEAALLRVDFQMRLIAVARRRPRQVHYNISITARLNRNHLTEVHQHDRRMASSICLMLESMYRQLSM